MKNKIKFITTEHQDKGWFLDIRWPLQQENERTIETAPLFINKGFNSKEEAYEHGKDVLLSQGFKKDNLQDNIEYL